MMVRKVQSLGQRGSMTIELAIIFPLVIMVMLVMIYIVLLYYQYTAIHALSNQAIMNSGLSLGKLKNGKNTEALIDEGKFNSSEINSPLYWRIALWDNQQSQKEAIEGYMLNKLGKYQILSPKEVKIEVEIKNYLLYQKIILVVKARYEPPVPFISTILADSEGFHIRTRSETIVKDPTEVIRNIDFAEDLLSEYEITSDLKDRYFDLIHGMKKQIQDFFQ